MSELKEPLELELPFGNVVFRNLDEVGDWVTKELTFWNWHDGPYRQQLRECNPRVDIFNLFRSPLDQINGAVNNIRGNQEERDHERLVADLRNKINEAYALSRPGSPTPYRGTLLHSTESKAQFVHNLMENNPVRAALVAAYYVGVGDMNYALPAVLDGAVTGILFDHGIKDSCEAEKAALEQLRKEWNDECLAAKKINKENEEAAKAWREKTEADRTEQTEEFGRLITKSLADLDEYEETIKAKIALQGPVSYWDDKAKKHVKASRLFGGFALGAFAVVGIAMIIMVDSFGPDLTLAQVKLSHIGLLAVGATVGVWIIRLLVRNYLSNVHLSHDAVERVAMMKTYLALLEERELEDKHRNLILQALFRPAATGIIKDDATPPFMAEWLKRTTGSDTK